ncbi:hypothetical protein TEA_024482 [Camellia sinensis var. sinensis]|uniref:F-box associated beta-propeller type 1 domain-containing protein n=1 Tax=Camellia sinensis var. sinensis TaxID=542762 RepID=A0A4S4DN92_CAMSN|nr:hypothetical protein TEA_024482 [Camellia sinensis var. sinensis]
MAKEGAAGEAEEGAAGEAWTAAIDEGQRTERDTGAKEREREGVYRKRNSDKLILRLYTDNDKKEHYLLCPDDENFPDDYLELPFPFKSPNGYFRIFGSCNGLLCLCDDYYDYSHDHFYGAIGDASQIVLWNPSIRKSVTICMPYKPPGCYMFVLGFGAHPTTHDYKVVRLVYLTTYSSHFAPKVELFTQGIGLWRCIDSAAPPYCMVEFMWSQAFVNRAVHWVAFDPRVVDGFRNLILSFNMGTEAFSEMMLLPTLADQHPSCLSVKLFGESLAVFWSGLISAGFCCIWVIKEYGDVKSWTKLFSINLLDVLDKTLGFRKNGEVLLSTNMNWLLSYHPGTQKMTNTGIVGNSYSFNVDVFMATLVLVKGENAV